MAPAVTTQPENTSTTETIKSKLSSLSSSNPPPKMNHYPAAQTTYSPPLIANENAFLGDVVSSDHLDKTAPVSMGFFRLEKGTPLIYTYTYHEMKIVVEGEFKITDIGPEGAEGFEEKTVIGKRGDCFYFEKGSRIKFETEERGLACYTGQRAKGAA